MIDAPGFTGGMLDRADAIRQDDAALASAMRDPRARLLRLNRLDPDFDGDGRIAWCSVADAESDCDLIFLGVIDGIPHFTRLLASDGVVTGRSLAIFRMLDVLSQQDAGCYAAARSLVDWHSRHRFCAVCGAGTAMIRGGWARKCPSCAAEHFPRVDPVVIMLVEHGDAILLGRGSGWPEGRYSALAGFVEVGESIEEAVARETLEEAGVIVDRIRYVASQPWPFPSSLMIACIGQARETAITLDTTELADARWFSRDDVRAALGGDADAGFVAPPRYAIAHNLLRHWIG